jgi:prepilin-type N-terminal cleavage/methylation domain-containing protein
MLKRGFTLIELLMVIFIVGILFSFSFPTLKRFCDSLALNHTAQAMAGEIRTLQAKAYTQHQRLSLDISRFLPSNIFIAQAHLICFSDSGFPVPGGSGTLILRNQLGQTKSIIVSSLGRVRIE